MFPIGTHRTAGYLRQAFAGRGHVNLSRRPALRFHDQQRRIQVWEDAKPPRLHRIVDRVGGELEYAGDFGDDWQHEILLEAILLPETDSFYPRRIGGARSGPPEDAGGRQESRACCEHRPRGRSPNQVHACRSLR